MQFWFGADRQVADYLASQLNVASAEPGFTSIGLVDDEQNAIGGVIFTNYKQDADITLILAADLKRHPKAAKAIVNVLSYPFDQLHLPRVSAEIAETNTASIRFAEWLGFKLEGIKRGDPKIRVYGLLQPEWNIRRAILFPSRAS